MIFLRGAYVLVEGGEGVGKSTLVPRLVEALNERGFDAVALREPGGSTIAEDIRNMVLGMGPGADGLTQLMLMLAARRQVFNDVVFPALLADKIVVADRGDLSTYVYQGRMAGCSMATVREAIRLITVPTPDITLLLHCDPATSRSRVDARVGGNSFDRLDPALLHQAYEGVLDTLKNDNPMREFATINTDRLNAEKTLDRALNNVLASPNIISKLKARAIKCTGQTPHRDRTP